MEKWRIYWRFYGAPLVLWPFCLALFVILIPLTIVVFIVRNTERLLYWVFLRAELLPFEDVVWTMGKRQNQLYINCCLVLDGIVAICDFRKMIEECLINSQDVEGNLLYWKVTKRIHPGYINYYWVDDEMFDLKDHVYELFTSIVTSEEELHAVISLHRSKELVFKNNGSPWEFILIPYQKDGRRKTVIFCRLSHAIADGSALAYFLINRMGVYQEPTIEQTILKYSQNISVFNRCLLYMKGLWILPVASSTSLFSRNDSNMLHVAKATGKKTISWTNPIDLAKIKDVKRTLNTTVNDALLGCLTRSLGDFFTESCTVCPSEISVIFPFDLRSSPDEAQRFSNNLGAIVVQLPTKQTDILSTIKEIKQRMEIVKRGAEPIGLFYSWKYISFLLPRFMSKSFIFNVANKTTGSISNLVGPQTAITIGGHVVDMLSFWPPQTNNHSFGAAFCSYDGQIRVGIETDHAALKEHKEYPKCWYLWLSLGVWYLYFGGLLEKLNRWSWKRLVYVLKLYSQNTMYFARAYCVLASLRVKDEGIWLYMYLTVIQSEVPDKWRGIVGKVANNFEKESVGSKHVYNGYVDNMFNFNQKILYANGPLMRKLISGVEAICSSCDNGELDKSSERNERLRKLK